MSDGDSAHDVVRIAAFDIAVDDHHVTRRAWEAIVRANSIIEDTQFCNDAWDQATLAEV